MFIAIGLSAPAIRRLLGMTLLVFLLLAGNPADSTALALQVEGAKVQTYDLRGDCFDGQDSDRNALAGVELRLFLVDSIGKTQKLVGSAKSDMGGGFEFTGLTSPKDKVYDRAKYVLLVRHPGYATIRFGESNWLRSKNELAIRLPKAGTLKGKFMDETGKPISGLTIFDGTYMVEPVQGFACTETGQDGKFELTDAKQPPPIVNNRQRTTMLRGIHPKFGKFNLMLTDLTKPLEIKLSPASEISGRVVDGDTKKPLADCIVVASLARSPRVQFPGGTIMPSSWITTRTDEDGNYKLSLFANANYNIWTYKTEKMAPSITVATGTAQQIKLKEIRLEKTVSVSGQLIDAATDLPITSEMRVSWHGPARPRNGAPVQGAVSNDDGSFTLQMVPGMNFPYIGVSDSEHRYRSSEVLANGKPKGKEGIMITRDKKTELRIIVEKTRLQ